MPFITILNPNILLFPPPIPLIPQLNLLLLLQYQHLRLLFLHHLPCHLLPIELLLLLHRFLLLLHLLLLNPSLRVFRHLVQGFLLDLMQLPLSEPLHLLDLADILGLVMRGHETLLIQILIFAV